ncbi:probable leucine-rich repeat receptor-like protein kinase At1g35710 [Arachis duranensis]|uniref:Probable leucine-rich repeat receptor-like protein kinase At1g35710 n=1 Tax=Arachis duranensis TaxID=130453 RepID=A0A6P4CPS7_ARADU|nr:probable leucine-rich repeat receptor-like protein kinase At1g35710 [Arachis duranensis]
MTWGQQNLGSQPGASGVDPLHLPKEIRNLDNFTNHKSTSTGSKWRLTTASTPGVANQTRSNEINATASTQAGVSPYPEASGSMPLHLPRQLCYNQLTGSIPTQLGDLKKLSVLALQSNELTSAIPASLGDLGMLMRLDLSSNQLFGSIPSRLADVTSLQVLDVHNNTLSGNVAPGNNDLLMVILIC